MLALLQIGCNGTIGASGLSDDSGGSGTSDDSGPGTDPDNPVQPPAETPAPAARTVRLTHSQWARSVQSLLQLRSDEATYVENLRSDPNQSGFIFDNNSLSLSVDGTLWSGYQRAATQLAEDATSTPERLARIAPESADDDDTRARRFIETIGLKAHRRPLTAAEVDEYFAVYTAGRTLYPSLPPFRAGIRLVLEAMLQSPYFVYRVETTATPVDGVIPLNSYEVASRLSYFLWNSSPDEALLAAAAADELSTPAQVRAQAQRMLADPRAEDVVARFHDALLSVHKFQSVAPSPAFFPDAPADLPALIDRENDLFIRSMFRNERSWSDVLTSNETFVNDDLARLYGLSGTFGPEFIAATLDPEERRGLFTQIGFLAANATSVDPDPIHRGVFISERIACNHIAAPPDDIPALPPASGRTNRETVEAHTEAPGSNCAVCHTTLINPFGWPFETYDAMGQLRAEDNGHPIDSTGSLYIKGTTVDVDDALGMATALAGNPAVHECYAEHWVEYALGRPLVDADAGLVHAVGNLSLGGGSIRSLLVRTVESPAFLARSTEELQ